MNGIGLNWILPLIKSSHSKTPITDEYLRSLMEGMPMMKNWRFTNSRFVEDGAKVAIVSGGLQQTARDIAAQFPSTKPWQRRWGGIDSHTSERFSNGQDSKLSVFTNGWLRGAVLPNGQYSINDFGRYQVQMHGKGAIVKMLQRRYNISKSKTCFSGRFCWRYWHV